MYPFDESISTRLPPPAGLTISAVLRSFRGMKHGPVRKFDVIVAGAGAAGLMCASVAGKRGRKVAVLERNESVGEKIRISGGGRCNFTNLSTGADNYLSSNPHFVKSALARFTPGDFTALLSRHGIPYNEKKSGQLFCDGSSREIIAMLTRECLDAGVEIVTQCAIDSVSKEEEYTVRTGRGTFTAASFVIATGGLSLPKLGATDFGYRTARRFGLNVIDPRPGLVPLSLSGRELDFVSSLSGISLDAVVSCGGTSFREHVLFTHRGLSGPAILQISSYWSPGLPVVLNLSPVVDLTALLEEHRHSRLEIHTLLSEVFPKRFARAWCEVNRLSGPVAGQPDGRLRQTAGNLHAWTVTPSGTEGYRKAEVTCGGVDTTELSSKTMESRKVPGLYIIGEVADVTGQLGGYNFQWAWASGYAAGEHV